MWPTPPVPAAAATFVEFTLQGEASGAAVHPPSLHDVRASLLVIGRGFHEGPKLVILVSVHYGRGPVPPFVLGLVPRPGQVAALLTGDLDFVLKRGHPQLRSTPGVDDGAIAIAITTAAAVAAASADAGGAAAAATAAAVGDWRCGAVADTAALLLKWLDTPREELS